MYDQKPIGWPKLNLLGKEYYDLVQAGHGSTIENRCQRQMEIVEEAMQSLSAREKKILKERFGLDGKMEKTLEEIGKSENVGKEIIRRAQMKALCKLSRKSWLIRRL